MKYGLWLLIIGYVLGGGLARAESVDVLLYWTDNVENTVGTSKEVAQFFPGYTTNATGGPPYTQLSAVTGSGPGLQHSASFTLNDLTPGTPVYFAVQACNANMVCSEWSEEIVHIVVSDDVGGDPNYGPSPAQYFSGRIHFKPPPSP